MLFKRNFLYNVGAWVSVGYNSDIESIVGNFVSHESTYSEDISHVVKHKHDLKKNLGKGCMESGK